MTQRRIVSENKILIHGEVKPVANIGHDLSLLHRINAQFSFEVLVQFDKVSRITRVIDDYFDDRGNHALVVHRNATGGRNWRSHCRRGLHFGRRGRCSRCSDGRHRGFAFPRRRGGPRFALNASMEIVFAVNVGHEFVLKNAHHDIVSSSKTPGPCQQSGTVDSVAFNGPPSHQGQGDLRAKTSSKAQAVFQFRVVATG